MAIIVILLLLTVLFILGSSEFNKAYTSCKSCSNILFCCKIKTRQFTCLHSYQCSSSQLYPFMSQPGRPPLRQGNHLSARASTSQPGCPPLSQGVQYLSVRASTSQPGCPPLIQGIHLSVRASTSQPGCLPLSQGVHLSARVSTSQPWHPHLSMLPTVLNITCDYYNLSSLEMET